METEVEQTPLVKQTVLVKRVPLEISAAFVAISAAVVVLGVTLGGSIVMRKYTERHLAAAPQTAQSPAPVAAITPLVAEGRRLYLMNCAHCHAPDASGDEGPDLRGVKKSDARISSMILNGVKGEMPRFGSKFKDADVQELIAYIRSLK